jgi:peptide/nickel transport system permease protein
MLEGAFVSLSVGFIAVGLAVFIGIVLGGLAGYYGPRRIGLGPVRLLRVDTLITALIDVMLSFPTFFLILTVVAILRPSIWNIMVVIGLTSWEGPARLVRAEILSLREREFVHAAQAAGASGRRMIARHLIPNAVGPVLVSATLGVAGAILIESSLSFLGFGVPPPNATWGNILADGKRFIFDAPWLTLVPGTAILIVVLAFNLFGEGLREAFNPRLREG